MWDKKLKVTNMTNEKRLMDMNSRLVVSRWKVGRNDKGYRRSNTW